MMGPLDIKTSINAMPVHAGTVAADEAIAAYRKVQDLSKAREENMRRPERIASSPAASTAVFHSISKDEKKETRPSVRHKAEDETPTLYGPNKKEYKFATGRLLDLTA